MLPLEYMREYSVYILYRHTGVLCYRRNFVLSIPIPYLLIQFFGDSLPRVIVRVVFVIVRSVDGSSVLLCEPSEGVMVVVHFRHLLEALSHREQPQGLSEWLEHLLLLADFFQ